MCVHKELHLYYNVVTARQQPSSMMNVHYHAYLPCPCIRCCSFNPAEVETPEEVGTKLSPKQWLFLIWTIGIYFYFCCCKSFHPWFCTLIAFSVTGLIHVIVVCLITTQNTSLWSSTEAQARSPETLSMSVSVGAWLPVSFRHFVSFCFTVSVLGFIAPSNILWNTLINDFSPKGGYSNN